MNDIVLVRNVLDEDPDQTLGAFGRGVDADEVDGFGRGGHGGSEFEKGLDDVSRMVEQLRY
jgi:hypothetical protein